MLLENPRKAQIDWNIMMLDRADIQSRFLKTQKFPEYQVICI
jgi:hypothetical protein